MAKGRRKSKLAVLERRLKLLYQGWGCVFCPAIGQDVYFTNIGWNHIRRGKRTKREVERRLKLLPLAKRLVQECVNPPTKHWRGKKSAKKLYFKLSSDLDNISVQVILAKVEGKYTFISDFEQEFRQ